MSYILVYFLLRSSAVRDLNVLIVLL